MADIGPSSRTRAGLEWRPHRPVTEIARATPREVAIGLSFDGRPHTVLMATPDNLEELAVGFTVTEAIATYADLLAVTVEAAAEGVLVDVRLAPSSRTRRLRPRTLEGRSSCGLCGVQRLADAVRPLPAVVSRQSFRPAAIERAVAELGGRQPLGRLTRATHAAGFAFADGSLGPVLEDVGRHNALDKLAGALLRAGTDPAGGFVVVTSRCSFEMVEKTARIGCPMLVAISAPTDLAIQRADSAGLTLVALARDDGHTVFSHPERLGLVATDLAEAI
ncbi:formate dehydrogenase accessory sulfurtransferase FdhD [Phenylobacterium sp.]|uniref:formate dehydrogenase accessory sulfurtransferase FdhD n=1 Tax=Phenylobacterium sp. TaxID=1871053 RepID=UPI00286B9824|nr:formate dehydrogenase accessory sulfurtransferase FdhD [Phenylobacterium sp.]